MNWPLWVAGAQILLSGILTVTTLVQESRRRRACRDTVESCGLRMVKASSLSGSMRIEAQAGPVTVRIADINSRKREFRIRIVAAFPAPPVFSSVRIRRETDRPEGAREAEVGDERFDNAFFVEGPARLLSVLLDAETRDLLLKVNTNGRLEIHRGEIRVETWDSFLATHLLNLLDLTRRFAAQVDVAHGLAENARQDPVDGVRLRNLLLLARAYPEEPKTVEALRAACTDPSPRVRLRAALELGTERRDILVEVAESLEDDACSAQAVSHLNRRELPFERACDLLAEALRRRLFLTARACMEVLGKSGDAAAVGVLAKVLAVEKGELAATAVLALGMTGSPAAERPLLLALRREKADVQVAAAKALGRAGSVAAVLPLKDAAGRSPEDQELNRATRQAIAEIQSRLQGASPGQLSLAEAEAGQLSLAQSEAGQLSLATDPAGQLALATDPAGRLSPPPQQPGQLSIDGEKEG